MGEAKRNQFNRGKARLDPTGRRSDYEMACVLITHMHAAALGVHGHGPRLGLVEDIAKLKADHDTAMALLQRALDALEYHREQTRPIQQTDDTIAAIRAVLVVPVASPAATPEAGQIERSENEQQAE
jgi:hypothetical protein